MKWKEMEFCRGWRRKTEAIAGKPRHRRLQHMFVTTRRPRAAKKQKGNLMEGAVNKLKLETERGHEMIEVHDSRHTPPECIIQYGTDEVYMGKAWQYSTDRHHSLRMQYVMAPLDERKTGRKSVASAGHIL